MATTKRAKGRRRVPVPAEHRPAAKLNWDLAPFLLRRLTWRALRQGTFPTHEDAMRLGQILGRAPFGATAQSNHEQATRQDEELLPRFVDLIERGEVTKSAAARLGIGYERAKRLRKLAVERSLLASRRR